MSTPAQQLTGLKLLGGWTVIKPIPLSPGATGGNFSVGYIVESQDGTGAFLKALDFSSALKAPDPALALQRLTEAFNFERAVLKKCKERRLDRIVTAITDGTVTVSGQPVQYLIFELADGDARSQANLARRFEVAWCLRALHHVATGLTQLHKEGIAHQDLKPSNVLTFPRNQSKIADLGRAAYKGRVPPHEDNTVAGDPAYAPPELLYGYLDPDWNRRRFGCDAYLMGSMVVFFCTGMGITPLLRAALHHAHTWAKWAGTYDAVLPYVRDAFGRAVEAFKGQARPEARDTVVRIVRELCEPDPKLRGHPLNRAGRGNQYSLERYVAEFDLLARRAGLGILASNRP